MAKLRETEVLVDVEACTGCGRCAAVCPDQRLFLEKGTAVVRSMACLGCGHCGAICPEGAIHLPGLEEAGRDIGFVRDALPLVQPGTFPPEKLAGLLASRRSCRSFTDKAVDVGMLRDLARMGVMAPSGTNCRMWSFILLPDRDSVATLGEHVAGFYSRLNRRAANPWLRRGLKLLGKPDLETYHKRYAATVTEALIGWQERGEDRLFYNAPAAILVANNSNASCPAEDALLATQNMLLGAHCLGLGSCLIGFAVEALRRDVRIKRALGLPSQEEVYAVIALGWPREVFHRPTGRRPPSVREWFGRSKSGA